MRKHIYDRDHDLACIRATRNVTDYSLDGKRILKKGIDPREIERVTHRTIPRYDIVNSAMTGDDRMRLQGRTLEIFRLDVTSNRTDIIPKNVLPKHVEIPREEMIRRHVQGSQRLTRVYQNSFDHMNKRHAQELKTTACGVSKDELNLRHQKEADALKVQLEGEKKIIENRHQREENWNKPYLQSGGHGNEGGGVRKKK